MRRMLALITVLALVTAGCGGEGAGEGLQDPRAGLVAPVCCGTWEGEALELQRRLVRWYGINLTSPDPEPGFREAYGSILAGPGGVMGWVRFPGSGAQLPVYHEGSSGEGFVHSADSPFPAGEGGTAVLTLAGDRAALWQAWLAPEPGMEFQVHILDRVLTYCVTSVTPGVPIPEGEPGEDRCLLIFFRDGGAVPVLGIRVED